MVGEEGKKNGFAWASVIEVLLLVVVSIGSGDEGKEVCVGFG